MKVAYFDCGFGAAGDMLLGALVNAGLPVEEWLGELEKIAVPLGSFKVKVSAVSRCTLAATKVDVLYERDGDSVEQVPVRSHEHEDWRHEHEHEHEHEHAHEKGEEHHVLHNPDHGRNLPEILEIIERSAIKPGARRLACEIFKRLGEAEAKVHGLPLASVHFHEVGAIDAIVDIVGFAIGYDLLDLEECSVSPLPVGSGRIKSEHGLFPVPGPAVLNLLAEAGIAVASAPFKHECLTPTGAAILCTVAKRCGPMPSMKIESAGYGAGTYDPSDFPNVCRVIIGVCEREEASSFSSESVAVIETNLDDLSPQLLSFAMERLFAAGALDVTVTPVLMKKNRSGHVLTVVCRCDARVRMQELILEHTSSLGVRSYICERLVAERQWQEVTIGNGRAVRIKLARDRHGKLTNAQPEYEDCAAYATEFGVPLKEVIEEALAQLKSGV